MGQSELASAATELQRNREGLAEGLAWFTCGIKVDMRSHCTAESPTVLASLSPKVTQLSSVGPYEEMWFWGAACSRGRMLFLATSAR